MTTQRWQSSLIPLSAWTLVGSTIVGSGMAYEGVNSQALVTAQIWGVRAACCRPLAEVDSLYCK
jgi:hypothetical protein